MRKFRIANCELRNWGQEQPRETEGKAEVRSLDKEGWLRPLRKCREASLAGVDGVVGSSHRLSEVERTTPAAPPKERDHLLDAAATPPLPRRGLRLSLRLSQTPVSSGRLVGNDQPLGGDFFRTSEMSKLQGAHRAPLLRLHCAHCVNPPKGYRVAGRTGGGVGGDGLANFATSIGAFGCTSLSSKFSFPSSHVTVQRNGILTPETSR